MPWRNGVLVGVFGSVVVVVVAVGGVTGDVGEGEEEVVGDAGPDGEEEAVDELELPVASIEIVASMNCIGRRTSERSRHIESRTDDCVVALDATSL